jgi:hypothetical protein
MRLEAEQCQVHRGATLTGKQGFQAPLGIEVLQKEFREDVGS